MARMMITAAAIMSKVSVGISVPGGTGEGVVVGAIVCVGDPVGVIVCVGVGVVVGAMVG